MLNKTHFFFLLLLIACDEAYVDAPGVGRKPPVEHSDEIVEATMIKFLVTLDPPSQLDPQHIAMAQLQLQVVDCEGQVIWKDVGFTNSSKYEGTGTKGSFTPGYCDSLRFFITDYPYYWRRKDDRERFRFRFIIDHSSLPQVEYRNIGYEGINYVIAKPDTATSVKILSGG